MPGAGVISRGDSSLTPFDKVLAMMASFKNDVNGETISFQFPPHITGESNSSTWEDQDIWAIEPLKIHKGSQGRSLTMKWEYIATDSVWTAEKIADNLRKLKGYFFKFTEEKYPIVILKYGTITPIALNFRMMSLDIAYSDEIVDNEGYHPFRTEVTTKLELATRINSFAGGEEKMPVKPLKNAEPEWY